MGDYLLAHQSVLWGTMAMAMALVTLSRQAWGGGEWGRSAEVT
jgi:hypothetical protein